MLQHRDGAGRCHPQAAGAGPRALAPPYRLDDAGWVANRWCELLPVPLAAKQKLMALATR
jgi:Lon protease-like protein